MPVQTNEPLYTVEEAASFLGLSKGTIRQYINRELLEPHRIGHAVMFTQSELERYQRERRPRGAQPQQAAG